MAIYLLLWGHGLKEGHILIVLRRWWPWDELYDHWKAFYFQCGQGSDLPGKSVLISTTGPGSRALREAGFG